MKSFQSNLLYKKYNVIICIIVAIILFNCKEDKSRIPRELRNEQQQDLTNDDLDIIPVDYSSVKKIVIPENSFSKELKLEGKKIIDTAWYVPLQTTSKSLLGQILKIEIHDDKIFVLEKTRSRLLVFSNKGRFLNQIGAKGHGPHEYNVIRDFCLDKKNKKAIVYDDRASKLAYYNYDGSFSKKESFPLRCWNFSLHDDVFFFYIGVSDNEHLLYAQEYNLAIKPINSQVIKKFSIPVDPNKAIFANQNYFNSNSESLTFSLGIEKNIIYKISEEEVIPEYKIIFDKHQITEEHLKDTEFRNNLAKTSKKLGLAIYSGNHLLSNNYIYLRYSYNNKFNHLIYNKKSKKNIIWNEYTSNDPYSLFEINPLYLIYNEDIFVTAIDSDIFPNLSPKIVEDKDKRFKNLCASVKESDNPILLFYKIRDMDYEQ
ncbi:6-bladed beta-propeller [Flavivirga rizhaonensis]|uniref:6-bladed beta-propeller n=1 Tax=Flavivirga rizhaonensis TaxID=2559571 RepID=A0A4S1DYY4_9FLAO|nr:6-bladed beta-propeller [Flavivirga rizhaonensis]TGV03437.1 6-bladed beta-propeller [Flavivirga rizhaonensis]